MSGLVDRLLAVQGPLLYALVAAVVFVEDALFVGFVVPGEAAAVLGGVTASLGHASLAVMMVTVAAAAITGDTVLPDEAPSSRGPRIGGTVLRWDLGPVLWVRSVYASL